jgi:hypothetical protein
MRMQLLMMNDAKIGTERAEAYPSLLVWALVLQFLV